MTFAVEIEERALGFAEQHLARSGWKPGVHARGETEHG
jgi:hypothetical protein